MSTTIPTSNGQNISNAVNVLRETYKNLNLLFSELDRIGEKEGFISITPRFLRWKSDSDYDGWLTTNFIKLYQVEKDPNLKHLPNLKDGFIYGIEVELEGEEDYPTISLTRYQFDYSQWQKTPAISDHWVFSDPFRVKKFFNISNDNGIWTSKPLEKGRGRYWGIQCAVSMDIPLLAITSPEDISTNIFQKLENLPLVSV
ncbi:hypothetical protein D1B31_02045 [Neobacillus notoginsengisoli]|uniref:Uncharacterized protein n=1 Tax=Neobacillus notoginsengisoli TaxID=1578198 RepID=A0A417Z0D6_9BACI|nr:hypothetical protein [Neobacillus notoginsengisoli]RHW43464.1 hypothetical protein D1B31_02045 [Neobacillus notoginsengisoli]